jgi:hypothetical protein
MNIDVELARKVLAVVDAGLCKGMGEPTPGKMCVEAAVNYAMGAGHGDEPACVASSLRRLKIRLNDSAWSSDQARARGLRRLAIAQLGSARALDEKQFGARCAQLAIQTCVPQAMRVAAGSCKEPYKSRMLAIADRCEREPTRANAIEARNEGRTAYTAASAADAAASAAAAAAYAADAADADAAAYAAYAADAAAAAAADAADAAAYAADADAADARDKSFAAFAEGVVQILIDLKAPGCAWLYLTEEPA